MDVSDSKSLKEWYDIVSNPINDNDEQQSCNRNNVLTGPTYTVR